MPIYAYKGLDKSGKEVKSSINSESIVNAKQKVRSLGVMLIEIQEQSSEVLKKNTSFSFLKNVNIKDLSLMTRQLSTLIRAKIQLIEALSALVDQSDNAQMRTTLSEVKQKVNEGSSLAHALADYPKIFDNVYINMVEAGESSGTLDVVLLRLAEFTESQVKLRNRIKGAMIYPLIMISFGSLMIGFIFVVVIPKITKIFISMKKTLPLQTQLCIWISNFLLNYWWAVLAAIIGGYITFSKYIKTTAGKRQWDGFLLKAPIVGELVVMINASRFCSTLATLLTSGVPILTAMKIVKNLISNELMRDAVEEARDNISQGASMTGPLIKSGHFPSMMTHMIKLGERSGEIEPMLKIVSENYEDEVNTKLGGLTSTLEPIMMIVMGMAVAFIVFSVVVPMMELNKLK
jgi:general secretion pathway protein F